MNVGRVCLLLKLAPTYIRLFLIRTQPEIYIQPSYFMETLQNVVVETGRWKKWLLPDEVGLDFWNLSDERKDWLFKTCSRYIWTNDRVIAARNSLYKNLTSHEK